jgi:hypothetical protein
MAVHYGREIFARLFLHLTSTISIETLAKKPIQIKIALSAMAMKHIKR